MANRITTVLDLDDRGFRKSIGNIRREIAEADGATNKFKAGWGSAMTTLKANAGVAALAAGASFAAFAARSISDASDLQESTNAVNKSFGTAAEGVLEIGESAAESFGLSKSAFNEAAVSFASFIETISGGRQSEKVLADLTTRASDFASVMNIDVAEAASVFRSGLSGETEPLKKFGIDLSAAAVESYALSTGLVENKKDLTEAMKVQARYGLLMESTNQFAGDFAETSGGLANSTRVLQARLTDLSAEMGATLIPAMESAVGMALMLVQALNGVKEIGALNFGPWDDEINEHRKTMQENLVESKRSAEETAAIVEAENKRIGAAYIQNQRGLKAWQDQVADDEAIKMYTDHAKGMQREADKTAAANEAATARIEAAWDSLNEELSDRSAYLDIEDALADVEAAYVTAMDTAGKETSEQEADARNLERAIIDLKGKVFEYGEEIAGLPPEYATEIEALIDEGKFLEVEQRLATLEKIRIARITPETYMPSTSGNVRFRAGGGVVGAGETTVVGEDGPEVVKLPAGSRVYPTGTGPTMAGATVGGGATFNITINADPNPDVTVRKLREFVRRNGPIQGIT